MPGTVTCQQYVSYVAKCFCIFLLRLIHAANVMFKNVHESNIRELFNLIEVKTEMCNITSDVMPSNKQDLGSNQNNQRKAGNFFIFQDNDCEVNIRNMEFMLAKNLQGTYFCSSLTGQCIHQPSVNTFDVLFLTLPHSLEISVEVFPADMQRRII